MFQNSIMEVVEDVHLQRLFMKNWKKVLKNCDSKKISFFLNKSEPKMELFLPFQSSVSTTFIKSIKQNSFKFGDESVDYLGNTLYNFQP